MKGKKPTYQELLKEVQYLNEKNEFLSYQLQNQKSFYEDVFTHSLDAIYIHDLAGNILDTNEAGLKMIGYTKEELKSLTIKDLMDEEITAKAFENIKEKCKSNEKIHHHTYKVKKKDGTYLYLETNAFVLYQNDKPYAIVGIGRDITERRKMIQALKKSEENYRLVADYTYDWEEWRMPDQSYKYISPSCQRITGYSPEDFLNNTITLEDLIVEDDLTIWNEHISNTLQPDVAHIVDETEPVRFRIKTKDNQIRWIEHYCQPVLSQEGIYLGNRGSNRDTTLHYKTESELQQNDELFRTIIETSPALLCINDENRVVKYISPNCIDFLGYTQKELIGSFSWWVADQDLAKAKQDFENTFKNKAGARNKEYLFKKKDGTLWYGLASWETILNENNQLQGVVLQISDITERKQMEKSLRENEEKYRILFENMAQGAFYQNADQSLVDCNKAVLEMFGLTRKQLLHRNSLDNKWKVIREDGTPIDGYHHPSIIALRTGKEVRNAITGVYNPRKKDYVWMSINAIPLFKKGEKKPYQVFVTLHDITKLKKTKEKLIKALEKAQQSDRLKSAFLANMSHEIRTPLNGILGFTELLYENPKCDAEMKQQLALVREGGSYLLALINDILELSKIEAGEININLTAVNLKDELNKIYESTNMLIKKMNKNLPLKLSIDQSIYEIVSCDGLRLKQILTNLLNNAIKFTDKGTVEYGVTLKDKQTLEFFVKDTGIGINPKKVEEIFKPFIQENDSISTKYGGTGLGLSITKKMAELLGGLLTVESKKGKGSVFKFTLPYEPIKTKKPVIENHGYSEKDSTSIKKILFVEDDEINAVFLCKLLKRSGYDYIHASTGQQALQQYINNPDIDLILMDIRLPDIDGFEVTNSLKEIQRQQGRKKVPILAITAHAMPDEITKSRTAGFQAYLTKPFEADALLYEIKKHL